MSIWQRLHFVLARMIVIFWAVTRRHQETEPGLTPHEICLQRIAELEKDLGMLSALTEAEFDAEVQRVTKQIQQQDAAPVQPYTGSDTQETMRQAAFNVWRDYQNRRYGPR